MKLCAPPLTVPPIPPVKMTCSTCGEQGHNCLRCPSLVPKAIEAAPKASLPLPEDLPIQTQSLLTQIALEVGSNLKKGRMECVYQQAIAHELQLRQILYTSEEVVPVKYKTISIGFERMDIYLPQENIVLELKATSSDIRPEHLWQLTNYMREKKSRMGLLVNFSQSLNKGVQTETVIQNEEKFYILKDHSLIPMTNYEFS
jgi:GxxExxY protein